MVCSSGGRIRLPTCVVRIRSVLRFMVGFLTRARMLRACIRPRNRHTTTADSARFDDGGPLPTIASVPLRRLLCGAPFVRSETLMGNAFETALQQRVDAMLDACTKCGKCVETCPITGPAEVDVTDPPGVIAGVLDIVRLGDGPEASRRWASACVLSGECIKVCDYGVNPRFLLNMARVSMARAKNEAPQRRRIGVDDFRKVSRNVTHLSRMQLTDDVLERLGQNPAARAAEDASGEVPDVVFYTGCNVLKTPHIALLALDI